jgi:CheY-like chemotaxis protein/HPt (histidine-containing phosphotransfer) domain-containing protein
MTSQSKPVRVLVIDDDPVSRDLLSVLLRAEGYVVECADSGEDAITQIHHSVTAPDLVLADAQMPGLDGFRLAGELRSFCPPETLLLVMSGSRPPDQLIARFDGFLLKPFQMEEVAAALAAHNSASRAVKPPGKQERWAVVRGPASRPPSNSRLVSIAASTPEPAASNVTKQRALQKKLSGEAALSGAPVLDETIYRQLVASMPAPQLHQMYAMCVKDARARIAKMRQLAAARDGAQFVRQAHAIKGSCAMLGATELHRMAAALEANGRESAASEGVQAVNSLDELTAACDRLERILGSRV